MSATATVSVLVPVYRGRAYVARALQSALAQTHRAVQVVVVNDGSPDDSRAAIEPFLSDARVVYIEKPNGGVASARNAGLRAATGEFVALLDQDDAWMPHKLERQLPAFADPAVALVHADVGYVDADDRPLPHDPHFPADVSGHCLPQLFMANPVMTCTSLMRRSVLEGVGGFDEAIRFSDDYDLWLRIARHHALAYVDEPLARYRLHDSNESRKTAGIVSATMQVLRKALATIPDCREIVGARQVHCRFATLHAHLSRHHFEQRQWGAFVGQWLQAARHDPAIARQRGLPEPVLDRLRWYSRRMGLHG